MHLHVASFKLEYIYLYIQVVQGGRSPCTHGAQSNLILDVCAVWAEYKEGVCSMVHVQVRHTLGLGQ